jgi:hypothetical protein
MRCRRKTHPLIYDDTPHIAVGHLREHSSRKTALHDTLEYALFRLLSPWQPILVRENLSWQTEPAPVLCEPQYKF